MHCKRSIPDRLWPDKKAMFIGSIDYVYEQAASIWQEVLRETDDNAGSAERLLMHEAEHYGESGLHRIIFAGPIRRSVQPTFICAQRATPLSRPWTRRWTSSCSR